MHILIALCCRTEVDVKTKHDIKQARIVKQAEPMDRLDQRSDEK